MQYHLMFFNLSNNSIKFSEEFLRTRQAAFEWFANEYDRGAAPIGILEVNGEKQTVDWIKPREIQGSDIHPIFKPIFGNLLGAA